MAYFKTWSEWIKVRESNARKRAVRAALNGTGPDLPGSYAACPSTNPLAMKVAKKKGVVTKLPLDENEGQKPDYSFDRWLQQAKEFGDDVNTLRANAETEDKELDKKKKDAEKEVEKEKTKAKPEPDPKDEPEAEDGNDAEKKKASAWKQLRQIHKDRLPQFGTSDDSDAPTASPKKR